MGRGAADAVIEHDTTAGLTARVPTYPRWTTADLVTWARRQAHETTIHSMDPLAEAEPCTIAVSPNDSDRGWTLSVRTDGIRTEPCAPSRPTRPSQSSAWACGTADWR